MNDICATCGTRYSIPLPVVCTICADDRQYVTGKGQVWTSGEEIGKDHAVLFRSEAPGLVSLRVHPSFAIGQRAFLVRHAEGNLLWDCVPYFDEASIAYLQSVGGLRGIAISHPHYYSQMVPLARRFGCPVWVHEADREWIMDPDESVIRRWEGERLPLWGDMAVYHTGGHFPGSALLHLPQPAPGSLLTGDSLLVARDRKGVTAMYSYPNLIPLDKAAIARIREVLRPLSFDALYAAFDGQDLPTGAARIVDSSLRRYLSIVGG